MADVPKEQVQELLADEAFKSVVKKIVSDCFAVVYDGSSSNGFEGVSLSPGPSLPVKVFSGHIPSTPSAAWMLEQRPPGLLSKVLLPAYRAAVKLALDQVGVHKTFFFLSICAFSTMLTSLIARLKVAVLALIGLNFVAR
jgi:hypothetical protein